MNKFLKQRLKAVASGYEILSTGNDVFRMSPRNVTMVAGQLIELFPANLRRVYLWIQLIAGNDGSTIRIEQGGQLFVNTPMLATFPRYEIEWGVDLQPGVVQARFSIDNPTAASLVVNAYEIVYYGR